MKTNIFQTALMVMSMTVISNAAIAASVNEMPSEASVSAEAPMAEYAAPSTASEKTETLLVDASKTDRVEARSTDVYKYRFYANEEAYIVVKGDGHTDLDLYIYDENDNLIDSDTDEGDICVCSFTPKWTGKFTIKVKNLGSVFNRYTIRCVQ